MRRVGVWLALLCASAACSPPVSAANEHQTTGFATALSPSAHLLVATEAMDDPRFAHAVILLTASDADGALGVIVNHPLGLVPADRLLAQFGWDTTGAVGTVTMAYGGPVEPETVIVVHSPDHVTATSRTATPGISVTTDRSMLEDICRGNGPIHAIVALGYAGWGAGQLDTELSAGVWFTIDADADLVFGPADRMWEQAVLRRGENL